MRNYQSQFIFRIIICLGNVYMQPDPLQIYLNKQQLKKFQTQKSFQLSNAQLASGTGLHRVQIQLHPHHHKRLLSSASKNKGFRFSPDTIQGGSVIGSIKGAASKVGSTLQKVGSTIKDMSRKKLLKLPPKKVQTLLEHILIKPIWRKNPIN